MNKKTLILPSPKKFTIDKNKLIPIEVTRSADLGTIEELKDAVEHQYVCISGKMQSISAVEQVLVKATGKQLTKQEVVLADGTAACRCVLWEAQAGKAEEGNSYRLENLSVRSFNRSKYLSAGEKAVIKSVQDIGYVVDDLCCDETGGMIVVKAEIVEVASIESYNSCKSCSGKVTKTKNPGVAECTKCYSKIKMSKSKSQSIARVVLQEQEGREHKVTMFGEVIQSISDISKGMPGNEEVCELSDLLLMSPFNIYLHFEHTEGNCMFCNVRR